MRISVALAMYNGEPFIEAQLQSLVDQTRRPDELVVADDGSTDATLEVATGFLEQAGVVATILSNNSRSPLRPPRNFERALARCSGDLVFCCDQDDAWDPSKLATVCQTADAHPDVACFLSNARFCDETLRPNGLDKMAVIKRAGLPEEFFVMGCCAAFRKSFLEIALPIPEELTHDGWLVGLCDLLKISHRSTEVLQSYRIHDSNVSKGFLINAAGNSSRTSVALARLRKRFSSFSSNQSLLQELLFVSAAEERLAARRDQIKERYPKAEVETALAGLRERKVRLEARKSIRQARLGARLQLSSAACWNGAYRGRGGSLNAIKDMLTHLGPAEHYRLWPR